MGFAVVANSDGKPLFKFDGTINWPFLLTAGLVFLGAIGFGNKLVGQIDSLQGTFQSYQMELKDLKNSVDAIRLDMAARAATERKVDDHEMRLRALELRPN
jgi:hypothetical protein